MPMGDSTPNLGPYESDAAIMNPQSNEEVAAGSLSQILRTNVGYFVVCEFLIGTSNLVTKEGILYDSGINFLTLYNSDEERYTVCDLYSLKFVTFYPARTPYLPQGAPPASPIPPSQVQPRMPQQPQPQQNQQQWQGTQQWQMPRPTQQRPPML